MSSLTLREHLNEELSKKDYVIEKHGVEIVAVTRTAIFIIESAPRTFSTERHKYFSHLFPSSSKEGAVSTVEFGRGEYGMTNEDELLLPGVTLEDRVSEADRVPVPGRVTEISPELRDYLRVWSDYTSDQLDKPLWGCVGGFFGLMLSMPLGVSMELTTVIGAASGYLGAFLLDTVCAYERSRSSAEDGKQQY